jgi:Ca2+-binding RTX toxin-like protein
VDREELRNMYCPDQSPDKRGGECKGTKNRDNIDGTQYDDRIAGLGDHDALYGSRGDDRLEGGPGDDYVEGGSGENRLEGGPGNDTFLSYSENDTFYGGEGRDTMEDPSPFGGRFPDSPTPPPDTDRAYGGADDDRIDVHDGDTDDVVSCGDGRDTVRFDKIGTASDKLEGCEVRYANPDYGPPGW